MPKKVESKKVEPKKVEPLSEENKINIVAEYLGVHPKYLLFTYGEITVDIWNLQKDNVRFDGFKPWIKETGGLL